MSSYDHFEFDFANYTKYATKPKVAKALDPAVAAKISHLHKQLTFEILSDREKEFIKSVEGRIKYDKPLTEKQCSWLSSIILKCSQARI